MNTEAIPPPRPALLFQVAAVYTDDVVRAVRGGIGVKPCHAHPVGEPLETSLGKHMTTHSSVKPQA